MSCECLSSYGKVRGRIWLRRVGLPGVLLLPMLIGGCGPTPEELLTYEMVVVGVGLLLGMAMWGIGYRLGRRIHGRWFVCSHCLSPQPAKVRDGETQLCASCNQTSSVNDLDRQTLREVLVGCGRRVSSWPAWRWGLFLTLCTFGIFLAISVTVRWLINHDLHIDGVPEWLRFPLLFTMCCCGESSSWEWPMIGYGLYFCSYHLAAWAGPQASNLGIPDWLQAAAIYPMIGGMVLAHWQVGLRRWKQGWLLPVGVAIVNAVIAVMAYAFHWRPI